MFSHKYEFIHKHRQGDRCRKLLQNHFLILAFMGKMSFTVLSKAQGESGGTPSLPDAQLSLATAGRLRRHRIYTE